MAKYQPPATAAYRPHLTAAQILKIKPAIDWCLLRRAETGKWPTYMEVAIQYELTKAMSRHAVNHADWVEQGFDIIPAVKTNGVIYFVLSPAQGAVKVSYSAKAHVNARFTKLQEGNPANLKLIAIAPADLAMKHKIRDQFTLLLISRDWYHYQEPLISYIKNLI